MIGNLMNDYSVIGVTVILFYKYLNKNYWI